MNTWGEKLKYIFKIIKKEKCLGINLAKHIQDLYADKYVMLMKETNEDLNKLRIYAVFMDWKVQHDKDVISPQIHMQIKCIF